MHLVTGMPTKSFQQFSSKGPIRKIRLQLPISGNVQRHLPVTFAGLLE